MYLIFDKLEEKKNQIGRSGKPFDCFIVHGKRKGFQDAPDTPYTKTIFDTSTVTVVEKGINRPGCSLLQYFQKAVKPGDVLKIVSERDGKFWRWASITKWGEGRTLPTYEPLDDFTDYSNSKPQEDLPWD